MRLLLVPDWVSVMKGMSWPSKNVASWLSEVKILGSERMLILVFWARAWRSMLTLTSRLRTEESNRPGRKLFLVFWLLSRPPMVLSPLVGVIGEEETRR